MTIKVTVIPGGNLLMDGVNPAPPSLDFDVEALMRGLHAVAQRYGVEPRDLLINDLARDIAFAREPELRFERCEKLQTKPTFWTPGKQWRLWFDFESAIRDYPTKPMKWLVAHVSKLPHWRGVKISARRYYASRENPLVQFCITAGDHIGSANLAGILEGVNWDELP